MSLTTKTPEHIVPAYNLPRGRAVDRGKVAEAAQETAEAEAPRAGWSVRDSGEGRKRRQSFESTTSRLYIWQRYVVAWAYPPRAGNYRAVSAVASEHAGSRLDPI